jgi:hypothetical protein
LAFSLHPPAIHPASTRHGPSSGTVRGGACDLNLAASRILDNAGYRVLEGANGDDAERLFARHEIHHSESSSA